MTDDGSDATLPDIAPLIAPILARVERERRPLLIALAERLAAVRYRGWAEEPALRAHRDALLACADREERIAASVEALFPDAEAAQAEIARRHPELERANRELFAGRPLRDQLAIQARAERRGAETWRFFAGEADDRSRARFAACAPLEEESAAILEAILASGVAPNPEPAAKPSAGSSI